MNSMSRRDFVSLTTVSGAALAAGCATNPVTGRRQLMLMSEEQEIALDRQQSPHQFSADYGPVQDADLNAYVSGVGHRVAAVSHRPRMPYSFRVLNASYVNAYTFPGGSMAVSRGIMLGMDSEAELAALLGHEIGHVNARHAARSMSMNVLTGAVLAGASVALSTSEKYKQYAPYAAGLGGVGAYLMLMRYSRDNEREADELGMDYAVKAGYAPGGMVGLMDQLRGMSRKQPNVIEVMFTTHPMSEERYQTAVKRTATQYLAQARLPEYRERYMDKTALLRRLAPCIEAIQKGDARMGGEGPAAALDHYRAAHKAAPDDYEALLKLATAQLALEKSGEAWRYARDAKAVYPDEPQAWFVTGMAGLRNRQYESAFGEFSQYETRLPGNPLTVYCQGQALDGLGRKEEAAERYRRFLGQVNEGSEAEQARRRLTEWGMLTAN